MTFKEQGARFRGILGGAQSVAVGTVAITFFTVISKGLGFVREMVLAAKFGTSWRLDAVIIAMEPAESLSGIIAGALSTMMIPLYIEVKTGNDPQKTARYASQVLKLAAGVLCLFSLLLFFFPDLLIRVFAPSFSGEVLEYAARKLKILAILPLIHGFGSIFTAVLRAERKFIQMASFQLIFNIISIPLLFFLAPLWAEAAYVFAWVMGYVIMNLVVGFYCLRYFDKKEFLALQKIQPPALMTLKLALPLIVGGSSGLINNIIDKVFASFLPPGRISALRYSQVLLSMITAIFVGSFLTTTYTEISESVARKDFNGLEARLRKTSNDLMNLVIPLTFWIILMAEPIIRILFQRGAFDTQSTELVSGSLIGYSIIIILTPIGGLVGSALISFRDVKFSNLLAFISIGLNSLLNWLFLKPYGHAGIAFSTTIVGIINTFLSYLWLVKQHSVRFFELKRVLYPLILSISLFICFFGGKPIIQSEVIWNTAGNLSFFILFLFFNGKLLRGLVRKVFGSIRNK